MLRLLACLLVGRIVEVCLKYFRTERAVLGQILCAIICIFSDFVFNMTVLSKEQANELYERAGSLIKEDPEEITLEKYNYLFKDSIHNIVMEVLDENPLPFKLQNFQLLTLYCIGSLKNVILVSPTGTGKMICANLAVKVLQKVLGVPSGVGLVTQPIR